MAEIIAIDPISPSDGTQILDDNLWTVGFYGPFRILTSLDDIEREIDVDDRSAVLNVKVEMIATGDLDLVARNVKITINFDFSEVKNKTDAITKVRENILFHGSEKGPLILTGGPGDPPTEISPDKPLELKVTVNTGLFSRTKEFPQPSSAFPGRKAIDVQIDYTLEPKNPIEEKRANTKATLQFVVAQD